MSSKNSTSLRRMFPLLPEESQVEAKSPEFRFRGLEQDGTGLCGLNRIEDASCIGHLPSYANDACFWKS